ncbi:hypothetical protein CS369_08445 [Candidatus Symbiopectobacterium sp. 'North America']|uniref:hypothetical protein n=1 Tax=Candidatus Symbiopectobacterium sp. 'North America' TaxID=2794574 RepID=UPI0018C9E39D|nr:hypothetical protein [Candidatus Symbiopectobacterium sp. 'North America']MBG6244790.1 hypothetical protein [Candidatus Symbiopectobacterium sp. 'North America']
MENALMACKGLLITVFGGTYIYLLAKLIIYTVNSSSEPFVWMLMIGGGAALLSLALAAFLLQPAVYLLAALFAGVGALISRYRRSHA